VELGLEDLLQNVQVAPLCEDAQANLSASSQEMGPAAAAAAAIEGGHAEMRYKEDEEGRAEMRPAAAPGHACRRFLWPRGRRRP
jgi:hypothetical protein